MFFFFCKRTLKFKFMQSTWGNNAQPNVLCMCCLESMCCSVYWFHWVETFKKFRAWIHYTTFEKLAELNSLRICIYVFREKNEDILVDCGLLHSSDEKEIIIGGSGNKHYQIFLLCVYRLNKMIVLGLSRFHKDSASYALVVVKNITLIKSLA